MRVKPTLQTATLLFTLFSSAHAHGGATADAALKKGFLRCGVKTVMGEFHHVAIGKEGNGGVVGVIDRSNHVTMAGEIFQFCGIKRTL